MSKGQAFWNERLSAAVEEKVKYEEEFCGFTEEIQRKYPLQDAAQSLRIVLVSGNVPIPPQSHGPNQDHCVSPQIKQEPAEQCIELEDDQLPIMEDNPGRKRKRKFDPEELKVLVDGVNTHYQELKKQNVTITRRNAIWQEITNRVNAVGRKDRTPSEIKRRWQDARRRTKEKVASNSACASFDTGGGPSEHVPLDTIEEQVLLTLCEEQVNGIPGIDSLMSDQDVCETQSYNSSTSAATSSSLPHPPTPPRPTVPTIPAIPAALATPRQKKNWYNDARARAFLNSEKTILSAMKAQSTSIQDGLAVLSQDIRSISKVTRSLRGDTRAISRHTRDLVSAVTGLTEAVKELTKAVSERNTAQQQEPENGPSSGPAQEASVRTLRKGRK